MTCGWRRVSRWKAEIWASADEEPMEDVEALWTFTACRMRYGE